MLSPLPKERAATLGVQARTWNCVPQKQDSRLSRCDGLHSSWRNRRKVNRAKKNQVLTLDFDLVTHSMWIHKTMSTVVSFELGKEVCVELKEERLLPSVGWVKWLPRAGHAVPGPRPCDGASRNSCVSVTDPHRLDSHRILEAGESAF